MAGYITSAMYRITMLLSIIALLTAGCRHRAMEASAEGDSRQITPVTDRVVGGLEEPVSLAFLSDNTILVAERRAGRIRWVENGRLRATPFATLPVPHVAGYTEHGLLGLAVDPQYPRVPYVYAFHTVPGANGGPTGQRVVRFTVRNGRGVNPHTIIDHLPASAGCCHDGGRLLFGTDGKLYVTVGDTLRPTQAQQRTSLAGKVLRYNADGGIPADNPFTDPQSGTRTAVFTLGHRNPFGIAVNPANGAIYVTENGPDRNDEINHLVKGANYGWPQVTGVSHNSRFRSPLWASGAAQIAPTGAVFYTGSAFPQFRGNLLFTTYNSRQLRRAIFDGPDRITRVDTIGEAGTDARLDVKLSPKGTLYFTSMDTLYRLRPKR